MNIDKDKIYPSLSEIEAQMERGDIEQLKAWGDAHNDSQWGVGEMAYKYIEFGFPVVQVCILIGNLTDYSPVAVKKFLATVRFYNLAPYALLLEQYKPWLRYSIMAQASRHPRPGEVLDYALKHNSSPMEIVKLFPVTEPVETEETKQEPSFFGVEYKAFARWGFGLFRDNENKKREFDNLLKLFMAHVKELL